MPFFDRFVKRWASTGVVTEPTASQTDAGFAHLGPNPPTVEEFNALFQWLDDKDAWLYRQVESVLLAGGFTPAAGLTSTALQAAIRSIMPRGGTVLNPGSSNFTVPANVTRLFITMHGGGGGGGGSSGSASAGSGGSGSGRARGVVGVAAGATLAYVCGAGGTRGSNAGGGGGRGGDSIFAGLLAIGGGAGNGASANVIAGSPAPGGGASGGYELDFGLGGGTGYMVGGSGMVGGGGGSSPGFVSPGQSNSNISTPQPGTDAVQPGCGAPGGVSGGNGGLGGPGRIVIEW